MQKELVLLVIEQRIYRVGPLRMEVANLNLPSNVKVQIEHGRYEETFRRTLDAIHEKGEQLAPTFCFVDPFGYSDAPMDLTGEFLQFRRTEVLVYLPLPFIARFVGLPGQERALNSLFGTDAWRSAIEMAGDERRTFLHDLFRDQLQLRGSRWVRLLEMQRGPGNGYHVFFGTSNELGLAKMKEAMWKADPVTVQRFTDSTQSDHLVHFDQGVDTAPLHLALRERFKS